MPILALLLCLGLAGAQAQAEKPVNSDSLKREALKKFYRPIGFSMGILYNRLNGTGARSRYIEETDSYDVTRLNGKSVLGFNLGFHVWRQRTQFQIEMGWSRGEFFEEGGVRSTTNGGSVDTYIDIGYFVAGFRVKQAVLTRKLLATGGIALVEEGRSRHAKTRSKGRLVESSSFPADQFNLWSWGVEWQLTPGIYFGYSYSWTFNADDFDPIYGRISDPPIKVEGVTMNSFQLTLVY
ncbi:MAG TPA: TonB-dependent receptor [Calditrichia bacterium]|nr:TonB-dependent receptor [Calditrichia bacterium]